MALPTSIPRSAMHSRHYNGYNFYVYAHPSAPSGYIPLNESLNKLSQADHHHSVAFDRLKKNLTRVSQDYRPTDLRLNAIYLRDVKDLSETRLMPPLLSQAFWSISDFVGLIVLKIPSWSPHVFTANLDFHVGSIQRCLTKVEWLMLLSNLQTA
jgi:hypothetical protein